MLYCPDDLSPRREGSRRAEPSGPDQALRPSGTRWPGAAPTTGRAAGRRLPASADADLRACGIREDDAARHLGRRRDGRGSPGGVGVAGGDGARARVLLDLRGDRPGRRGPRRGCGGPAGPPVAAAADGVGPRHAPQRAGSRGRGRRPGARRLPPGRRRRDRGGRRVPTGAPSSAGAPGDQHPRRPGPTAGPTAGAWRARRGTRGRPPVHPRRGGGVPERRRRTGSRGRGRRGSRGTHRGLDRRLAARGPLAARTRGRRRVHRRLRGRRSVRRRLPRRGGARPPVRDRPRLPARHLDPRTVERAALRCGHRRRRRQGRARVARAGEPVRRTPRRQSPLVPLPPPVRRCPARASPRGAA